MSRDLSKSTKAQKNVEQKTESKFGQYKEDLPKEKTIKSNKPALVKLTATIEQAQWDYLQSEALKRGNEKGKVVTVSEALREILEEYKNK